VPPPAAPATDPALDLASALSAGTESEVRNGVLAMAVAALGRLQTEYRSFVTPVPGADDANAVQARSGESDTPSPREAIQAVDTRMEDDPFSDARLSLLTDAATIAVDDDGWQIPNWAELTDAVVPSSNNNSIASSPTLSTVSSLSSSEYHDVPEDMDVDEDNQSDPESEMSTGCADLPNVGEPAQEQRQERYDMPPPDYQPRNSGYHGMPEDIPDVAAPDLVSPRLFPTFNDSDSRIISHYRTAMTIQSWSTTMVPLET
jgi:hypothetical protein